MLGILQGRPPARSAILLSRTLSLSAPPPLPHFLPLHGLALTTHVGRIIDAMPNRCPPLNCVDLQPRKLEANNDISGTGVSPPALSRFVSAMLQFLTSKTGPGRVCRHGICPVPSLAHQLPCCLRSRASTCPRPTTAPLGRARLQAKPNRRQPSLLGSRYPASNRGIGSQVLVNVHHQP
jgi:hypothetical protein